MTGKLKAELERIGKVLVSGQYFSNAYNMEVMDNREEFLKVASSPDIIRIYHNDLPDLRVSDAQKAVLLAQLPYLTEADFTKIGSMYLLDQEEYICSDGCITVRYVERGE